MSDVKLLLRASAVSLLLLGPSGMAAQDVTVSGQIRPRFELHTSPEGQSSDLTTMGPVIRFPSMRKLSAISRGLR